MNRSVPLSIPAALLAFALGGCTSTPVAPPVSDPMPPAHALCHADAAASLVGQPATEQNVELARQRAGAQVARVLKPGQVVTLEYLEGRLNVHVDAVNVITRLTCG
jgi:hypothetical protein